jgi:hypothetical protein
MTPAHIDEVAPELAFFDELFELLHIEGVVQKSIELVPLVYDTFPACPPPDREGGGEVIVVRDVFADFFGVESGNHADAGVMCRQSLSSVSARKCWTSTNMTLASA